MKKLEKELTNQFVVLKDHIFVSKRFGCKFIQRVGLTDITYYKYFAHASTAFPMHIAHTEMLVLTYCISFFLFDKFQYHNCGYSGARTTHITGTINNYMHITNNSRHEPRRPNLWPNTLPLTNSRHNDKCHVFLTYDLPNAVSFTCCKNKIQCQINF